MKYRDHRINLVFKTLFVALTAPVSIQATDKVKEKMTLIAASWVDEEFKQEKERADQIRTSYKLVSQHTPAFSKSSESKSTSGNSININIEEMKDIKLHPSITPSYLAYLDSSDRSVFSNSQAQENPLTESQLLNSLSSQGREIYKSLDAEGKGLAIQLATEKPFNKDKNLAVKEAQRRTHPVFVK